MIIRPKNYTAISLLVSALLLVAGVVFAGQAATVTHVSGPLVARKADGAIRAVSIGSGVDEGDTVVTEKRTYARLKFNDGGEVTLKPNSQFKVEKFSYNQGKPKDDAASYNLIKGGLRAITGQVGKRGNPDSYQMKTPTATIGVRGTAFIAEYVQEGESAGSPDNRVTVAALDAWQASALPVLSDAAPVGAASVRNERPLLLADSGLIGGQGGRAPGLYVQVLDGIIHVTNGGGSQNFSAGQFGFTAGFQQPPVILPSNPGMQFTPPPSFSSSTGSQGGSGGSKPGSVDCVVR